MNGYIATVSYSSSTTVETTGESVTTWTARVKIGLPPSGLQQSYSQIQFAAPKRLLADSLALSSGSLEKLREVVADALEALTELPAFSTRFVDLQPFGASPAAVEEFKVAKEQRKAA